MWMRAVEPISRRVKRSPQIADDKCINANFERLLDILCEIGILLSAVIVLIYGEHNRYVSLWERLTASSRYAKS